jgi:hypothetical protein
VSIRDQLNENPRLSTGLTAGIILVVLAYIIYSSIGGGSGARAGGGVAGAARVYFTDDDGATWFADDATKVPPFDHNGKPAYRAHVYKCGGKTFVNHMERYTPEGKKEMEAHLAKGNLNDPTITAAVQQTGMEVKSPGAKAWIKSGDPKAPAVLQPKCPDGGQDVEVLLP